jgi:hypothetical protein
VVGFVPRSLCPWRRSPRYLLDRRVGGNDEDKCPCPCWEWNLGYPVSSLVTILTELAWVLPPSITLYIYMVDNVLCWMGSLSPRHGASSGCGWRKVLRLRRVAANVLNKQSRTADKGWSSSLGVGRGANNPSPKNFIVTKCFKL